MTSALTASVCPVCSEYSGGELHDWDLNVGRDGWNQMTPKVSHPALGNNMWYSDAHDFAKQIPQFQPNDGYIMRWRGE